ncbi:MAG: insulinase family protein [Bdellovibrionaceae bacterium]|nr:insulinase family protein [Pseudobdellovibrionaceae bacterium]
MVRFKKTVLSNGIRVVSELHPSSRAVSLGVWVEVGTRDEKPGQEGLSHFIEHLVFKGTRTRTAYQIVRSLEALGGELNAYTTKEYTCYHAMVLKNHWSTAMDVLADLTSNMKISARDFKLEKGVILQEIAMAEDNHDDIIYDHLHEQIYGRHALAKPILGSVKSIALMKMSQVMEAYRENYSGRSIIVSAAGNIDHAELVTAVEHLFRSKKKTRRKTLPRRAPRWSAGRVAIEKDGEQVHCLWAFPTVSFRDRRRFESYILNAALGGGMTSRLYQAVRERKGLVYNIHSMLSTYEDSGMISIYAGAELAKVREVGEVVAREIRKIKKKGIPRSDVELFKTQVIGAILLGSDDVENRMSSLAANEMVFGRSKSPEEVVEEIRAIDEDRMNEFLQERLQPEKMAGVLLGPGVNELATWWKELEF